MPFQKDGKRNYEAEKNWEKTSKPSRVKDRAKRNAARKEAGLKVGDPREADHKKPLVAGGSNAKSNIRIVSAKSNANKEAKRKKNAK